MHIPVLLKEVIDFFNPQPGEFFIDCTAGGGGHTIALAERVGKKGKILAIDWDAEDLQKLQETMLRDARGIGERVMFAHGNFAKLKDIAARINFPPANGILFDLGFSRIQLEEGGKGLSFQKDEFLDMRFDRHDNSIATAEQILRDAGADEIENILRAFGEERYARAIARHISESRRGRPIHTTFDLVGRIEEAIPDKAKRQKIHFATRTFQALRIMVNRELDNIKGGLGEARDVAANGGRVAVISFHSLEDRLVKNTFRSWKQDGLARLLTKKPVRPSAAECGRNPSSRSAKLRVCEII